MRRKIQRPDEFAPDTFTISISDLMSGLTAIFILVLSYFILNFSQAAAQLTQNDITRAELLHFIQDELEREGIKVDRHGILRISESVLFDVGLADVKPQGQIVIKKLSGVLEIALEAEQFKGRVETIFIEGHTDDVPISNGIFPSNWELSAKRAIDTWLAMSGANPKLATLLNDKGEIIFSIRAQGVGKMSLRDELKNLRDVARRLNVAKFDFEMPALKNFVDGLETLDNVKPPENFLRELLTKFLRGEEKFSRREIRSLPFIIFEPTITLDGVKKILSALNFFQRSHMRAAVSVYLLNYDTSAKTELLRRKLLFFTANTSDKRKAENLFGDERFTNMTKLFAKRQNVLDVLKEFDLSNFYRASNFIHVALKNFFRTSNLSAQIKILAELDTDHAAYKNMTCRRSLKKFLCIGLPKTTWKLFLRLLPKPPTTSSGVIAKNFGVNFCRA